MSEEKRNSYDSSDVGDWAVASVGSDEDEYVEELKQETAPPLRKKGTRNHKGPSTAQWDDALSACDDFDTISHAMSKASMSMSLSIKLPRNSSGADDFSEISHDRHSIASAREAAEARQKALQKQQEFVRKETWAVRLSKLIVVLAIIAAGVVCSLMTNKVVKEEEKKDFKSDVKTFINEIGTVSHNAAERAFNSISSLSKSITSSAVISQGFDNSTNFPFYSMPFFHVQGAVTKDTSGAEAILFAPLVPKSQKAEWEEYSRQNQGWLREGLDAQGMTDIDPGTIPAEIHFDPEIRDKMPGEVQVGDYFLPVWQMADAPMDASIVNLDLLTKSSFAHTMVDVLENRKGILSEIADYRYLTAPSNGTTYQYNKESSQHVKNAPEDAGDGPHPQSYILEPVFASFEENAPVVGFIIAVFPWNTYFADILPEGIPVFLVIKDGCGHSHTYEINGKNVWFLGEGDLTRQDHAHQKVAMQFAEQARYEGGPHPDEFHGLVEGQSYNETYGASYDALFGETNNGHCAYVIELHPTTRLEILYESERPKTYAWAVVAIFGIILVFLAIFDLMVVNRQRKLMATARKTDAVVRSLFPENVQKRILADVEAGQQETAPDPKNKNSQIENKNTAEFAYGSKPIADYFASASIMFADIAGFTAWSSTREPTQVFSLLEKIYHTFDDLARSREVFKVETVGDCYVAAAGLPEIRTDHAVIIARFARDCLNIFPKIIREMEVFLGPGDLGLRVGLHSGAVTAGVLRGEKSRFQLFGDTVNTASRMESTGVKGKIQISQTTKDLLFKSGLKAWIKEREITVTAKGKGEMQTYWLLSRAEQQAMEDDDVQNPKRTSQISLQVKQKRGSTMEGKTARLIEWNVRILKDFLKQIVAARGGSNNRRRLPTIQRGTGSQTVLDEVKEIITLPEHKGDAPMKLEDVKLSEEVLSQLQEYVTTIAKIYRSNPFHNFEHASHVTQSVTKLLSRIVAPDTIDYDELCYKNKGKASTLHDHTYGITSDPLTQFACAFSAMIHDADHTGIPNIQLVKEHSELADKYKNKSVAEQNSVDLCWDLLMTPAYEDLRRCIYNTQEELDRFRQLVVNSVMATDIVDKELGAARKQRWEKAFSIRSNSDHSPSGERKKSIILSKRDDVNRKATIVIEHLIQASDVAHTMQHWHVYLKWNERLFHEVYQAYLNGRGETDPSIGWYQGELGFFDFYIIPLAKKLKECGVFGVSSDEYLDYARANRLEWEQKGKEIVAKYIKNHNGENAA